MDITRAQYSSRRTTRRPTRSSSSAGKTTALWRQSLSTTPAAAVPGRPTCPHRARSSPPADDCSSPTPAATTSRSSRSIRPGWNSSTAHRQAHRHGASPSVEISSTSSAPVASRVSGSEQTAHSRRSRARARPLSTPEADGAQISFTPAGTSLVVTERGTDAISTYSVGTDGLLTGPTAISSSGATPYGFDFGVDGILVVTEAFGGQAGAAAASSYRLNGSLIPVSASVKNTRSEVCWAAVSQGRPVRLRDQLRRQHHLELRHRSRRIDRAARSRCRLHAWWREGHP